MKALGVRNKNKELFNEGDYIPLEISGKNEKNLIAYARKKENNWVVVVAPRFLTSIIKDTELPIGKNVWKETFIKLPGKFRFINQFTADQLTVNNHIAAADILKYFPLSLLTGKEE
jgi:(1->4)-alpha-D-glucan 1-alpha-D-glucosylmutase